MSNTIRKISIANSFSRLLRQHLHLDAMKHVVILNALEDDKSVCHTHDFCDANVHMINAFKSIMGREADSSSEEDINLINSAWDIAKYNRFGIDNNEED